jgi:hypothetical protein
MEIMIHAMRQLFLLLTVLFASLKSGAVNYYVSAAGSDAANGTSLTTPWQSITKINASTFRPGDNVLFRRGDTFYGTLVVNQSGAVGNPIVFGAYGVGSNPVITGFTTLSGWRNLGGNIYEYACSTCQLDCNMVTVADTLQPIGRWPKFTAPNEGYLTFQSHSGNNSITSNAIAAAPNFVGGEIVIRKDNYILDRERVTAQTSTVVMVTPLGGAKAVNPSDNWGFFFQNHVSALTSAGDWCFDSTTKNIKIFGDTMNVKAATLPYLVKTSQSYLTFDHITFSGCDSSAFTITRTPAHNIIQNCTLKFSGIEGIIVQGSNRGIWMDNDSVLYSASTAINAGGAPNWVITNCVIMNSGMIRGMGQSGGSQGYIGIWATGHKAVVEYNRVINTGYIGIRYQDDSCLIYRNFVDSFCVVLGDGGGIYTYSDSTKHGRIIRGNIIINGPGDRYGTNRDFSNPYAQTTVHGLYFDNNSRHAIADSNTVAFCVYGGMEMNSGTNDLNVQHNTFYNNGVDQADLGIADPLNANIIFKNNLLFSDRMDALMLIFNFFNGGSYSTIGSFDSNYYCRPFNEPMGISTTGYSHGKNWEFPYSDGGIIFYHANNHFYSLDTWKTFSGHDTHSSNTPFNVKDKNKIRFEYNPANSVKTISLGSIKYKDVYNTLYSGTMDLQPYSSVILIATDK